MWAHLFEIRATILHLAAWSGISASLLVALGAMAFLLPEWRAIALRAGAVVAIAYVALVYGSNTGRAEVTAQWDAANARAAAAQQQLEADAAGKAEAKYTPVIAQLQRDADERSKQGTTYERWILGSLAAGGNPCAVGPGGLQLRRKTP